VIALVPQCAAPPAVQIGLQGVSTTARIDVWIPPMTAVCPVRGTVKVRIVQAGKLARVRGNHYARRVRAMTGPQVTLARLDWANWCGSRRRLRLQVTFGGRAFTRSFPVLPLCLGAQRASRLVRVP